MSGKNKDYRFTIANREALIGIALAVINFVWWYGFAYGLGSKSPENYHFVLGLPAWFFYSCVVGFILIVALVIVVVKFFFVDVPFEEEKDRGNES
ncbi:YhdT family protein [Halobacillus naozhouensis]|uniref:YhdT family protein n=1 Tax=Halobacillus naozhouensis TaxID=554880 RepID=A0ABY8IVQ7_9BACI|nr:YhdT family protein [Halobacillus naozhouensis]WFT73882.1 YhdT family protein [Halobacillus naozhouensis]